MSVLSGSTRFKSLLKPGEKCLLHVEAGNRLGWGSVDGQGLVFKCEL